MNDASMSTTTHTLQYEIDRCNDRLDCYLKERFGMSLQLYKIIKAATQLLGAAAGVYSMSLGADPMAAFVLIATIVSGPEALEAYFSNATTEGDA